MKNQAFAKTFASKLEKQAESAAAGLESFYGKMYSLLASARTEKHEFRRNWGEHKLADIERSVQDVIDMCIARYDVSPNSPYQRHLSPLHRAVTSYEERIKRCRNLLEENTYQSIEELHDQIEYMDFNIAKIIASCMMRWEQDMRENENSTQGETM